jgi:hypothetical protein
MMNDGIWVEVFVVLGLLSLVFACVVSILTVFGVPL